jgi:ribosomal protein L35AE/L33A
MKRIIRLTESDLVQIVKRVIKEQDEKVQDLETVTVTVPKRTYVENMNSDLYGKTVTFKDEETGTVVKGKIKHMAEVKGYDDVSISFDDLYMLPNDNYKISGEPNIMYGCGENVFFITVYDIYEGKTKRMNTFTCKGLSDVLNDRLPCKTDFVMNNTNVKSSFA